MGRDFSLNIEGQLCLLKINNYYYRYKPQRDHNQSFHLRASLSYYNVAVLKHKDYAVTEKSTRWFWCSSNQKQVPAKALTPSTTLYFKGKAKHKSENVLLLFNICLRLQVNRSVFVVVH